MAVNTRTVQSRMGRLVALMVLSLVATSWLAFDTMRVVRVNGPYYQRIVESKDLIADILPPPAYIIESYLVAQELCQVTADERGALIDRLHFLRDGAGQYAERHQYWADSLPRQGHPDPRFGLTSADDELYACLIQTADAAAQRFYALADEQLIPPLRAGDTSAARTALMGPLRTAYAEHRTAIDRVVALATTRYQEAETAAARVIRRRTAWQAGVMLLVLAAAMALGRQSTRAVTGQLLAVSDALSTGGARVSATSEQLATAAAALAAAAADQAVELGNTGRNLAQLSELTERNADCAAEAHSLASSSRSLAQEGGSAVSKLTDAIGRIAASSHETATIVKTIDDIAAQTNLLALNAAVEAARAGDAGLGFAVVAQEVRSLARRSADAAQLTGALIDAGRSEAEQGVAAASEVEAVLSRVSSSAEAVLSLVTEVREGSQNQARDAASIRQAVGRMDQAVRQASDGAREAAESSQALRSQAYALNLVVAEVGGLVGHDGAVRPAIDGPGGAPRALAPPRTAP